LAVFGEFSAVTERVKAAEFSKAVVLLRDEGEEMAQPTSGASNKKLAAEVGRQISSKQADWVINS
jgi:hypothetical protein